MQEKRELEDWYAAKDPWKYETTPDDLVRKLNIINLANFLKPDGYERALDIGAGEGWITKDLPAQEIWGYEISDKAAERFPANVKRVLKPDGFYDLVVAAGVLYPQYNWRSMINTIKNHSSSVIIVAGIVNWFVPEVVELGKPVITETFPYRQYTQCINVFIAPDRTSQDKR